MHIIVDGIFLRKLDFELLPENIPENVDDGLSYGLGVKCHSYFSPEKDKLVQMVEFDIARGVEKPPFKFQFTLQGQYHTEGEGTPSLEEFSEFNAPAYVVPYARELIANMTSRISIIPTLVIPPINVVELLKHQEKEEDAEGEGAGEVNED
jgi:preprotein translocase subunit SecB